VTEIKDPQVSAIFEKYPQDIQQRLLHLRALIFEAAGEVENLGEIEETTKWGEPSYVSKQGSTIRIDWKEKNPDQYCIYFHCKTKLVDTFREIYSDLFNFDGNRAIIFQINRVEPEATFGSLLEKFPEKELKHCIALSLNYHRIKHLPLLGV